MILLVGRRIEDRRCSLKLMARIDISLLNPWSSDGRLRLFPVQDHSDRVWQRRRQSTTYHTSVFGTQRGGLCAAFSSSVDATRVPPSLMLRPRQDPPPSPQLICLLRAAALAQVTAAWIRVAPAPWIIFCKIQSRDLWWSLPILKTNLYFPMTELNVNL
jgi:hypothetical protein